jgi:hypothetical protein
VEPADDKPLPYRLRRLAGVKADPETGEKPRWKFERDALAAEVSKVATTELEEEEAEAEDSPKAKDPKHAGVRADGGPNQIHVWTHPTWKNPYASRFPNRKPLPRQTRAMRLASVMRVLGRPLNTMSQWPEVIRMRAEQDPQAPVGSVRVQEAKRGKSGSFVGIPEANNKAEIMAEHKAVLALRASLEKSIEKLAARRDILRAELNDVEDELKKLLAMLKASGADEISDAVVAKVSSGKSKPGRKPKGETNGKVSGAADVILAHLKSKNGATLTADQAAELTGQDPRDASQTLGRMCRAEQIAKVSRGVYGGA